MSPFDPASLAVAGTILLGVVLLASLIPARKLASVEPLEALGHS